MKPVLYGPFDALSTRPGGKIGRNSAGPADVSPHQAGVRGLVSPQPARHLYRMDRRGLLRRLPLAFVVIAALVGLVFFRDFFSFEALATQADRLTAIRDAHFATAATLFVLFYAAMVGLSLPGATLATLTGGFLFGLFPGLILNLAGATAGAVAVFAAVRMGIGAEVARKLTSGGGGPARLVAAIRRNEWSALLIMRFLPVVPFFAANLIPAFVGVRFWPYAVTTAIGILPGAIVLTALGRGLGEVIASGGTPDLSLLRAPAVVLPLLGLAVLAAIPMIWRVLRRKEG